MSSFRPLRPKTPPSAMPCPNCRRLISINAERCIHCGFRTPRYVTSIPLMKELLAGQLSFVDKIVLACFVLFVLALGLDIPSAMQSGGSLFGALSPSGEALYQLGMGGRIPAMEGRLFSFITATYLHGGVLHILFNMLWLRSIGPLVEAEFGPSRFWIIYTLAGLAGAILSTVAGTYYFVGASGSVFGLFGALIFYGWRRGGTFGSDIFRRMLVWAGFGFVFGFLMPQVDNWGHLGGFLGGLLAAAALNYQERQRQKLWHHFLALGLLVLVIAAFTWMVISFFNR